MFHWLVLQPDKCSRWTPSIGPSRVGASSISSGDSGKVKCTLVQALRLCTGRRAHSRSRGIALLFLDHGTRRWWGVSVTPRPLFTPGKDPVPVVQEAGWAPGPVWTGAGNLASTGIRSLDRAARNQSLYQLSYPAQRWWRRYLWDAVSRPSSKMFRFFCETPKFIIIHSRSHHWTLSRASLYTVYVKYVVLCFCMLFNDSFIAEII